MTDRTEETLRRVLEAQAASVTVSADSLDLIRGRTSARTPRGSALRRSVMVTIGTGTASALAVATVAVLAGVGSCQPAPTHRTPPATAPVTAPTTAPAPAPGTGTASQAGRSDPGTGAGTPTGDSSGTLTLPVYYVGPGLRLYREYHALRSAADPAARVTAAVAEMLGRTAHDPDYTSPWPSGAAVRSVRAGAGAVTVDLSGAGENRVDAATAGAALAQLVWTVTAVSGTGRVYLELDGSPATVLWGAVPASGPLGRGPGVDVLGPIWLIEPQQGDTVGRSFTVHLAGFVSEAQGNLRVETTDGGIVAAYPVRYSAAAPVQGEATIRLTLPPGRYTIVAYDVSERDGSVIGVDDHAVTVR